MLSTHRAWLLIAWLAMTACTAAQPRVVTAEPGVPPHLRQGGDFADTIAGDAAWQSLRASPGREMTAHTEIVKVIIDLADDWRVYFLQSERWEIHYYFAERFLGRPGHPIGSHEAFNIREYRRPDRRFVLGTLVHYRDQDTWAFELIAGDALDIARTARAFEAVRSRTFFGPRLRYRPVPPQHETHVADLQALGIPIVTTQEIFGATRYQPVNPGAAFGYLRFVQGLPDPSHVRRNDIVVLDNVPLDLPVCAGVITAELQTPLSHISVLAANRGTPNMALRGAITDARLRRLDGRLVQLHVSPQDWSIEPATQADAERAWESRRPRVAHTPALSLRDRGLPDIRTLLNADVETVGAKAAQLGELAHIGQYVNVPRGFALPFAAYAAHLARNRLDVVLNAMLADPTFASDPARRELMLRDFRDRIEHAPIDPAMVAAVSQRITELFPGTRVRFRSSTNAEDLAGFNGAGLYRSIVVGAAPAELAIANTIRAVWASVWTFQGFEERAYFRIDQARVAMAILVQESIDDDVVNGVAITGNPFNQGRPALFVNAQVAGDEGSAVTSARGDDVPEQILYYTYGEEREFERISRSSRTNGAAVLSDDEVYALSLALRSIHARFYPSGLASANAMDVEFILSGPARRLVIVQARPYLMRWDEGRGWAPRG